jgi:Fic family protein
VNVDVTWFSLEDKLDPVVKAALTHMWFVTIHPFDDGNGPIARAIADMSLARSEDSPQRFYELVAHGILARDEAGGRSTSGPTIFIDSPNSNFDP